MAHRSTLFRSGLLLAALTPVGTHAQTASALPRVTITTPALPGPEVGGFGNEPLSRTPLQASIFSAEQLRERGAARLSDVTRLDASVSDAYNAPGYWDSFTIRGFVLDNRSNFRRDGLPVNAETSIPLDNKARVEVLKGLTGLQAGSATPGGLVNLVVKRPLAEPLREARVQWEGASSLLAAVDVSDRLGDGRFGWRVNAAAERLRPEQRNSAGDRHVLATAVDARLGSTFIEAEFETSQRSQPSVPGQSLLGGLVPAPGDPRLNLNNQPWSQPVVFGGNTGSLRITQAVGAGWSAKAHAAVQRLHTDDRLAFPFGCSAENTFDRYCSDGTFDLYDYRSENERRRQSVAELSIGGPHRVLGLAAETTLSVQRQAARQRLQRQAFNFVGTGNIQGTAVTPADPALTDENTQRDERSTEWSLRHLLNLTEGTRLWIGLRQVSLARESVRTDGSRPTAYTQSYTLPWLALSHAFDSGSALPGALVYASVGDGAESAGVPGRSRYLNAGQALPMAPSRQAEAGFKLGNGGWRGGAALFDIRRPVFSDRGACDDAPASCERVRDGDARHRGVEADLRYTAGRHTWAASAQWLRARREASADAAINGLEPVNVPARAVRGEWRMAGIAAPGLDAWLAVQADSSRSAVPDGSARIGASTRWDAGLRWQPPGAAFSGWIGIDNLTDTRAWKESPFQFGHSYLYPQPPRTVRLGAQITWR